jgi:hypothetical protein
MLRLGIIGVLLVAAFPAAAQLHKCIDERGRTHYTDKPVPGCTPVAGAIQPGTPSSQPAPSAAAAPAGKPASKFPVKPPAKTGAKATGPAAKPYVATAPKVKAGKPAARDNVALRQEKKAQLASRCKSMKEEYDWLVGPRGERVENRAARIDQVKRAMNACP